MFARVAALVWLSGCQLVFGREDLPSVPSDGGPDGVAAEGDEDRDGVPDDVDNCPGITNGAQLDSDQDQVGDACDPRVDDPGDTIAKRYFFNDPVADAQQWAPTTQWMFETGSVTQLADSASLVALDTPDGSTITVEVGFRVKVWGRVQNNEIDVYVDQVAYCYLSDAMMDDGSTRVGLIVPNMPEDPGTMPELVEEAPARVTMTLDRVGGGASCHTPTLLETMGPPSTAATFSFATLNNRIAIDYVVVYSRP